MKLIVIDAERCVGCQSCMFACARRHHEAGLAKSCIVVHSSGGMERGFKIVVCRACEDPPCPKVCPTGALRPAKRGGVRLDLEKCHGCGNCRTSCLLNAIFWNSEINKPMICSNCGYCAKFCPHGVIAAFKEEEKRNMLRDESLSTVLHIDLSKKSFRVEKRPDLFEKYRGGAGVAIQLLHENCPHDCDPLGPENPIILAVAL